MDNSTGPTCITYDVLEKLCLTVDLNTGRGRKNQTVTDVIEVAGCFDRGKSMASFSRSKPGWIYKFEHVPIEVRSIYDPSLY